MNNFKVISLTPAVNPNGEKRIMVVIGSECPLPLVTEKKPAMTYITVTPGQGIPPLNIPLENRVILFLSEEEWDKVDPRPTINDNIEFNIDKGKIIIGKGK